MSGFSHWQMFSRFIHIVVYIRARSLRDWIRFCHMYITRLARPCIHLGTFELFSPFAYCQRWCDEHSWPSICLKIVFDIGGYTPGSGAAGLWGDSVFNFSRCAQTLFYGGGPGSHSLRLSASSPARTSFRFLCSPFQGAWIGVLSFAFLEYPVTHPSMYLLTIC